MYMSIVKNFKKYHRSGLQVPQFSPKSRVPQWCVFFTTAQTFGDQHHIYTIVAAIDDKSV